MSTNSVLLPICICLLSRAGVELEMLIVQIANQSEAVPIVELHHHQPNCLFLLMVFAVPFLIRDALSASAVVIPVDAALLFNIAV